VTDFVKSATTSTPVAKSQADIIGMLRRYGATGFGFHQKTNTIEVLFHMPTESGDDRRVCIPVSLGIVREKLDGPTLQAERRRQKQAAAISDDQVERVAWRVLYLWIDAALSAVSLGAQTIEEAFFAHLIVTTEDGKDGRLVEYMANLSAAAGGSLLPMPRRLALGAGSSRG
jgi:hypothetical protein